MDKLIHDTGYGLISRSVMRDKALSITAKALYSYLCSFANTQGESFPSRNIATAELGINKDTYTKYLNELKSNGYLTVKQTTEKGVFKSNHYFINSYPCLKLSDTVEPDTVQPDTVVSDTKSNSLKSNSSKSNKSSIPKLKFTDEHMELATLLLTLIKQNNPDYRMTGNLEKWANDIRLMEERENRTLDRIYEVIVWSQNDSFWKSNILSAGKFRDKFNQLTAKMQKQPIQPSKKVNLL